MAKGKPAPKSTDAEVQKRVNRVYDMLLMGTSRASIIEYGIKLAWGVVDATVDQYISKANKRFKEQSQVIHDEQLGLAIARLNKLFEQCEKIQDYKSALAVQKDINALLGLYAPKRTELANADGKPFQFQWSQVMQAITDDNDNFA